MISIQKAPKSQEEESIRFTVNFSRSLLEKIDKVRKEWGLRSRGATVERILQELFEEDSAPKPMEKKTDHLPLQEEEK